MAQWGAAAKAKNGGGVVKQTSQRSLLFRQNVNRTEAEWGGEGSKLIDTSALIH